MKILITTDSYIFNVSGVTTSIVALCKGLREKGHEVKTLSPSNLHRSYRSGDDYFVKSFPAFYYPDMRVCLAMNDPLIGELIAWKPDVIHAQSESSSLFMALKIKKQCHVPLIMTCHTDYEHYAFGPLRSTPPVRLFMKALGKKVYSPADKITVPSKKAAGFSGLSSYKDDIVVIPNGLILDRLQKHVSLQERLDLRKDMGFGDDVTVFLSVTRLSKEKDIGEIISFMPGILKIDPKAVFLIVGDGPDKAHLEKMTKKLQLEDSVIFTGKVSHDEIWRYFCVGDIYVSASTFEVHSISYLEALAFGLPMLCREDDSLCGVVEHGENGFIYGSEQDFMKYASQMIKDGDFRRSMGESSLRIIQNFSYKETTDSMIEVYMKVIEDYMQPV